MKLKEVPISRKFVYNNKLYQVTYMVDWPTGDIICNDTRNNKFVQFAPEMEVQLVEDKNDGRSLQ